jgi:hypothetical protein
MDCDTGKIDPKRKPVGPADGSLTYNPLTGKYTYLWKTDHNWAGACASLVMKFVDGTERSALFHFIP